MQRLWHWTCTYQEPKCSPVHLRILTSKRLLLQALPPPPRRANQVLFLLYAMSQHFPLALTNGRAGVAVQHQEDNDEPEEEDRSSSCPATAMHQPLNM